jgi:thiamine biosynthesis lipoprotein
MDSRFSFEAIGTWWVIDVNVNSDFDLKKLQQDIFRTIDDFDSLYSRFRDDSLVSKIAQSPGVYELPFDGREMLELSRYLYCVTNGAFTPFIGNLLSDAGYDKEYSFISKPLISPLAWDEVIELRGSTLTVHSPVLIDFGGIGKGYLIDKIGKHLDSKEITSYCIDGSGDILYKSADRKSIRVGLENPDNEKQVIGVATISSGSICASAGNKRKWGTYHHIMNPFTRAAENSVKATWVLADTATVADALATCLFFTKPKKLLDKFKFEYVIIYPDNSVAKSPNIPVEFY